MFANHMPDGINFQGPEGNLYIFCQKKEKKRSGHTHVYLEKKKKRCGWASHTK